VCTLAIYFHCSAALPVVVAANRDEFYDRPTADPRLLSHDPWVMGGQDLHAGGTWFGINEHRMIVGMLNRRSAAAPDPSRKSRGLLCLEALQQPAPQAVRDWLGRCDVASYNPFNLLAANEEHALVATSDGRASTMVSLSRGLHLLTNLDLNDPTCPRIATSHRLFAAIPLVDRENDESSLVAALRGALASHDVPLDPRGRTLTDTLCIHSPAYGTRSSTIVVLRQRPAAVSYWHAAGPPCSTEFSPVALPQTA
jgi:uncharacterized protein with NRDE domain